MLRKPLFLLVLTLLLGATAFPAAAGLSAQEDPWSRGSVGTGLLLRKLDGIKRVLMIGAHPDDEDTALLAALSRGMGVETAYLSLSRGEGGQNLIGPELGEGLGVLRTGELLAARALDGGRQFFTRAFDFGYSKTAEEALRIWPRDELLEDVTWVVRTFRPQVIVSVFSGTSRDGHGQHQAAGIVAHEVFDVAGDPARFPAQIALGASPWTPSKLYLLTRRNPQEGTAGIETGAFDPLLGRSYYQVAMDSRSQHRSQDMGARQSLGPRRSTVALVRSRTEEEGPDEFFAGVDTTLFVLTRDLPEARRLEAEEFVGEYRSAIASARESLDAMEPWRSAPALGRATHALAELWRVAGGAEGGLPSGGTGDWEWDWFVRERMLLLQKAILSSSGIVLDVRVEDDLLVPGQEVSGVMEVWNGGPYPLSGAAGLLTAPEGWDMGGGGIGGPEDVPPGSMVFWEFTLRVPDQADVSRLYYLEDIRDEGLYRWPEDPALMGQPGNPEALHGRLTVQVGDFARVRVSHPVRFKGVDKATGEFVKPLRVVPALSVTLDPPVMTWPLDAGETREFTVTVVNQGEEPRFGMVGLFAPAGWRVEPEEQPVSLTEVGAEGSFSFRVTPPAGVEEGGYSLEALVRTIDGLEFQEGVSLVDYPHVPRGALFTPAHARVSVFPVAVLDQIRVGYIMGSGDSGPAAIRQMGVEVEVLGPEAVRAGAFQGFDVLVLGIRAYETRPDLVAANDRVLEFARNGGTVIVQYNKYEFPRGNFAPYPVEMSRPHDRVSDETAAVRLLEPEHPAFTWPNRIGEGDFEGWVQERGLYFLRDWDEAFTPLLEMADPGEEPKRGGLLVAPVGEGLYVYTGLAFFRQFPQGVSGAYRLFANLLSLKGGGNGGY